MVRTEVVDEKQVELMKRVFGSAANAWTNLGDYLTPQRITWWLVQRAFTGKGVELRVVRALDEAMDCWLVDTKLAIKKRRKELAEVEG